MSNPTYTTPTGHALPCPQPGEVKAARTAEGPTPPPWAVETDPANLVIYAKDAPCIGNLICYAPEGFSDSMANWPANATLIAAAPDMLAALQDVLYAHRVNPSCQKDVIAKCNCIKCADNRACVAVAKAKDQTAFEATEPPAAPPLTHSEQYAEASNRG